MKTPVSSRFLTHAGAVALGATLAWSFRGMFHETAVSQETKESRSAHVAESSPSGGGCPVDVASRIGKARLDFAGAWAALSSLSPEELDLVRWKLLKEWIADDPDAALEAVVALDDETAKTELLEAFGPLFEKNPDWFLAILQSHRLGLRGVTVRDWWASRMAASDPARLVRIARGFEPLDGAYLMSTAMAAATSDQTRMNDVFAALQEMPSGPETTRLWTSAGKGLSRIGVDLLESRYLEATNSEVKGLFGLALAKALADKEVSPEQRAETLARTPPDRRTSLALDMANEAGKNSAAITSAIDSLIDTADWSQNAKHLAAKLHNTYPSGADAARLATWAATIPPRGDTEDLYRTAMRYYLQQRPAAEVREWMTGLPPGWRRDNTLATWVQSNANFQKFDEAQWALERIQSPHFRSEGEKWIANAKANAK